MRRAAAAPETLTFPNGRDSYRGTDSVNVATRYLCIAPYLRRAMLPREIIEPNTLAARPPLPVGRNYALRVLFGVEGELPMPGISVKSVRRHCRLTLVQTSLRDAAAIATVATVVFLAPLSTFIALALIVTAITLIRRIRLTSPPVLGALTGVTIALFWGWRGRQEPYAAPLISLGICFLIYLGDIIWSLRQIEKLSQKPPPPETLESAAEGITVGLSVPWSTAEDHWGEFTTLGRINAGDTHADTRVYYDKDGIIGAGASSNPFPLTIPLDNPLNEDHEVTEFTARELLMHIKRQIISQGVGDGKIGGHAYSPESVNGDQTSRAAMHFTYGLPDLQVDTVIAAPFPHTKKYPILPIGLVRLDTGVTTAADRSPSTHPDRRYVRAITVSWDGQLVISVYVSAALQGHYLHVMIRPYVLAPITSELKSADDLLERQVFVRACMVVQLTAREFAMAAYAIRALTGKRRKRENAKNPRPPGRSTRERYAQRYLENMNQEEDAQRIIRILERKIAAATIDYLRKCNIGTGEYEAQIIYNIENHAIGGGAIYSGTFTGPIATATGQGATATGQGGPAPPNSPSSK